MKKGWFLLSANSFSLCLVSELILRKLLLFFVLEEQGQLLFIKFLLNSCVTKMSESEHNSNKVQPVSIE